MKNRLKSKGTYFRTIFFCLLAIQPAHAGEPSYDGKPLSEWLVLNLKAQPPSGEAIRQIGVSGIPTLIDILGVKKGTRKKVLAKLNNPELKQEFSSRDANLDDLRNLAVNGFAILGTNAESAVPQLAKMFHKYDETLFQTTRALTKVGQKGISVLTNAMNNPDESVRNNLIWVLGEEGGKDPTIIRLLIDALKDPYGVNRGNAAQSLAGKSPDLVIPALVPLLDDDEYYPRAHAAMALGSFGPAAKSVAPKLYSTYTNVVVGKDRKLAFDLSVSFLGALGSIDRELAAKAEAFMVNTGPLNFARFGYSTTLLPDGKELIAGGYIHTNFPTPATRYLSSAELYDPATGKWDETGELSTTRNNHTAILLRNGKVLIVGGSDGQAQDSTSAELYDLTTGKWIKTSALNHTHRGMHAILQANGKVRIPGGWDGFKITSDELYDPGTGKWAVITNK